MISDLLSRLTSGSSAPKTFPPGFLPEVRMLSAPSGASVNVKVSSASFRYFSPLDSPFHVAVTVSPFFATVYLEFGPGPEIVPEWNAGFQMLIESRFAPRDVPSAGNCRYRSECRVRQESEAVSSCEASAQSLPERRSFRPMTIPSLTVASNVFVFSVKSALPGIYSKAKASVKVQNMPVVRIFFIR